MSKVIVRSGDAASFFDRALEAARHADAGQPLKATVTLAFEDPQVMFNLLSDARRRLMRELMHEPRTISDLARRLQRNRSAVTKDLGLLERKGLVVSRRQTNPGHGLQKFVQAVAPRIEVMSVLA